MLTITLDWSELSCILFWVEKSRKTCILAQLLSEKFLKRYIYIYISAELDHPFSIDVFEDYIYGVTYINNNVFRVNKFGRGQIENLTTRLNHATDIVLHHRYKQPESE